MINLRKGPARLCVAATLSLLSTSVALAAVGSSVRVSGRTSQRRPISFQLSRDSVTQLRYQIDDICPGGSHLLVRAYSFPPLSIKHGRFGGKFAAKPPHKATAIIKGRVSGKTVSGTLFDRTQLVQIHGICVGHAKFKLARR